MSEMSTFLLLLPINKLNKSRKVKCGLLPYILDFLYKLYSLVLFLAPQLFTQGAKQRVKDE